MTQHVALGRSWRRDILRLAGPALGALAAEPLYVLVDTAVVGHLGTPQLGGLAIAGTVLTTAFWMCNFLAFGTTSAVGRLVGGGATGLAAARGVQATWLALGLGVVLLGVFLSAGVVLVDLVGASDEVRPYALTYLRVSALGAPAALVALAGAGYLRGLQDTRTTLVVALASNVANLALELVLIYGLGYGIGASAAATVVAQWGAAAVYIAVLGRNARAAGVALVPARAGFAALATAGGALFLRTGSLLAALAVATAVAARMGTAELAAHQVGFQVWSLLALLLDALAVAAQALVARLLGARQGLAAREVSAQVLRWGVVSGAVAGATVLALRPVLAALFSADPAVQAHLLVVLVLVAAMQPLNAVVFVLDGVLIGAGDLRYLAAAMAVSGLVVFVPLAAAVHLLGLGLAWLWVAVGVLMVARFVAAVARFRTEHWVVEGA